jgi:hypothetical protein
VQRFSWLQPAVEGTGQCTAAVLDVKGYQPHRHLQVVSNGWHCHDGVILASNKGVLVVLQLSIQF